ncbi:hypothetical protein ColTof4_12711 [Colletotrichum tofieldiae]|nr:hypothetical protein ColTof3_14456 [Colletotrichum tofieldiae]GKT80288.1 hypothetical protein ColTof4_12711 [Colletotrichum tofieldiae]GKT94621.1 hypothetical protein Ct61P_12471 [Colletotrichum tofieldiae]
MMASTLAKTFAAETALTKFPKTPFALVPPDRPRLTDDIQHVILYGHVAMNAGILGALEAVVGRLQHI